MSKMMSSYWSTVSAIKRKRNARKRCSPTTARHFFRSLQNPSNKEKDIDGAWHDMFTHFFIDKTKNPDHLKMLNINGIIWDGYMGPSKGNQTLNLKVMYGSLRLFMEFKRSAEYSSGTLQNTYNRAAIMAQVIHYMKKIRDESDYEEPNVIVGADQNEAFVLPGKLFYSYLKQTKYNWNIDPRAAFENHDPKLTNDLRKDGNMNVFPFRFDCGSFQRKYSNLLEMLMTIDNIGNGRNDYKVPINPNNMTDIYSQFKDIAFKPHQNIHSVESVNIFMQLITAPKSSKYYINPHNTNLFYANGRNIEVNGLKINAFMSRYNRKIKPHVKKVLKGIADRLIKIEPRRFKGDFWTPSVWAKDANKLMENANVIDPNYKTNSLVWDCAAGVRNLTRDFSYTDLYISTYHEAEIELGSEYNKHNRGAFQYDFLQDDVLLNPTDNPNPKQWKMPNSLFNELKSAGKTGKRVIFYTNPPYGLGKNKESKHIADNEINKLMKGQHLGNASHQLFAQFFWRIFKIIDDFNLKNVYIAFFTEVPYFSGGDWKGFDRKLFSRFKWEDGFMLSAGEFSGTAKSWAINFSVFKLRDHPLTNKKVLDNLKFNFTLRQSYLDATNHRHTRPVGKHTMELVYNSDSLTNWAKAPWRKLQKSLRPLVSYPQLSSGLKESKSSKPSGKMFTTSLGYMVLHADSVEKSVKSVYLLSSAAAEGHGLTIEPDDKCFNRAIVAFAARKSIKDTWVNDRDNFAIPNVNDSRYREFVNDSLIFSLFSTDSNQTSFRNDKYSNTGIPGYWANKWFWLSNEYVQNTADDNDNDEIYEDAEKGHDTYVYKQIKKRTFSKEAQAVLDDATNVWKDLFQYRNDYSAAYPEYYLNTWDAGWYQLKLMPNITDQKSFTQFKKDFKVLTKKISNNVYNLGMLKK